MQWNVNAGNPTPVGMLELVRSINQRSTTRREAKAEVLAWPSRHIIKQFNIWS